MPLDLIDRFIALESGSQYQQVGRYSKFPAQQKIIDHNSQVSVVFDDLGVTIIRKA